MLSTGLSLVKGFLPDWPEWALDVLLIMTALLALTLALATFYTPDDEKDSTQTTDKVALKAHKKLHKEFDAFRHKYIVVYLIIMLADWMQGTHMYTLYASYNVNISALFLTGFLSGAIFAPFLGSAVDKFGRKRSCIVYLILEIIINCMEHSSTMPMLLMGRVLGGISTNLLFSAFESWMTTEHRHRGFPEEWLTRTYAEASIGNGAMAILAGIVAQILEDNFGHIGPFQGAIALTSLALLLVLGWEENYGEMKEGDHDQSSLYKQFIDGWTTTMTDSRIWRIGMTQALSEGAMYTFVFMWVPTLISLNPSGGVPTGCVFSALMMAITMGGVLFPPLQSLFSVLGSKATAPEASAAFIYLLGSISMAIPALCLSGMYFTETDYFNKIITSFLVMEFSVGLFMPVAGTLRSKYIPDSLQGAILNIFRLPLNVVVVVGTYATDHMPHSEVYKGVSICLLLAALLQASLIIGASGVSASKVKKE